MDISISAQNMSDYAGEGDNELSIQDLADISGYTKAQFVDNLKDGELTLDLSGIGNADTDSLTDLTINLAGDNLDLTDLSIMDDGLDIELQTDDADTLFIDRTAVVDGEGNVSFIVNDSEAGSAATEINFDLTAELDITDGETQTFEVGKSITSSEEYKDNTRVHNSKTTIIAEKTDLSELHSITAVTVNIDFNSNLKATDGTTNMTEELERQYSLSGNYDASNIDTDAELKFGATIIDNLKNADGVSVKLTGDIDLEMTGQVGNTMAEEFANQLAGYDLSGQLVWENAAGTQYTTQELITSLRSTDESAKQSIVDQIKAGEFKQSISEETSSSVSQSNTQTFTLSTTNQTSAMAVASQLGLDATNWSTTVSSLAAATGASWTGRYFQFSVTTTASGIKSTTDTDNKELTLNSNGQLQLGQQELVGSTDVTAWDPGTCAFSNAVSWTPAPPRRSGDPSLLYTLQLGDSDIEFVSSLEKTNVNVNMDLEVGNNRQYGDILEYSESGSVNDTGSLSGEIGFRMVDAEGNDITNQAAQDSHVATVDVSILDTVGENTATMSGNVYNAATLKTTDSSVQSDIDITALGIHFDVATQAAYVEEFFNTNLDKDINNLADWMADPTLKTMLEDGQVSFAGDSGLMDSAFQAYEDGVISAEILSNVSGNLAEQEWVAFLHISDLDDEENAGKVADLIAAFPYDANLIPTVCTNSAVLNALNDKFESESEEIGKIMAYAGSNASAMANLCVSMFDSATIAGMYKGLKAEHAVNEETIGEDVLATTIIEQGAAYVLSVVKEMETETRDSFCDTLKGSTEGLTLIADIINYEGSFSPDIFRSFLSGLLLEKLGSVMSQLLPGRIESGQGFMTYLTASYSAESMGELLAFCGDNQETLIDFVLGKFYNSEVAAFYDGFAGTTSPDMLLLDSKILELDTSDIVEILGQMGAENDTTFIETNASAIWDNNMAGTLSTTASSDLLFLCLTNETARESMGIVISDSLSNTEIKTDLESFVLANQGNHVILNFLLSNLDKTNLKGVVVDILKIELESANTDEGSMSDFLTNNFFDASVGLYPSVAYVLKEEVQSIFQDLIKSFGANADDGAVTAPTDYDSTLALLYEWNLNDHGLGGETRQMIYDLISALINSDLAYPRVD